MNSILENIEENQDFLVMDGRYVAIGTATLREEAFLYNVNPENLKKVIASFQKIAKISINEFTCIRKLSGGQKALLSTLIAIYSPAPKILFFNFFDAIDQEKKSQILEIVKGCKNKTIEIRD